MVYSKICIYCGNKMYRNKKSEAERENWKFCSHSCKIIFYNKKRQKDYDGKRECKYCYGLFPFRNSLLTRNSFSKKHKMIIGSCKQIFCSRKCSTLWLNKNDNPSKKDHVRKLASERAKKKGVKQLHTKSAHEKQRQSIMGEKHWNWQGGKTSIQKKIRNSYEMKLWRNSVFKRDNWTCVLCFKVGGILNADHIKTFSSFPELRFEISNGRTLCVDCHRKTDTFGGKRKKIAKESD
jgi:DNA-directed RNA polymerase subunit M/transcription elongation factor TFIIS